MMRLNLQLTMGTFSLSLFGLMGVAFGMNLESSFEEVGAVFFYSLPFYYCVPFYFSVIASIVCSVINLKVSHWKTP